MPSPSHQQQQHPAENEVHATIALSNAPAVAAWHTSSATNITQHYLGQKGTARIGLDIRLISTNTALLDLRIPIGFQGSSSSTAYTTLHFLIPPSRIMHIAPINTATSSSSFSTHPIPDTVTEAFTTSRTTTSAHDILGLHLTLSSPGDLIAPASSGLGVPRSRKAGEMLSLLKTLAVAQEFEVYFPRASLSGTQVAWLCDGVNGRKVGDEEIRGGLGRLYGGAGGAVVSIEELGGGGVGEGNGGLPAYEDVAPAPIVPAGGGESSRPGKRRRLLSDDKDKDKDDERTEIPTPVVDGKLTTASSVVDIHALASLVHALQSRVQQLEDERDRRPRAPYSTRSTGTQTSPLPSPSHIEVLNARVDDLATSTNHQLAQLRHDLTAQTTLLEDTTAHLEGSIADVQYQCAQDADAGLEQLDGEWQERLTGIEIELQEFVTGEMEGVEARIKRDFEMGRAVFRVEWDE